MASEPLRFAMFPVAVVKIPELITYCPLSVAKLAAVPVTVELLLIMFCTFAVPDSVGLG